MPPEKKPTGRQSPAQFQERPASFYLLGALETVPSTKTSRFQQQNKRFGKIFRRGGDTDVQCSAFRGHTIRIFALKDGRPAPFRQLCRLP